jgi:hypothetical protein
MHKRHTTRPDRTTLTHHHHHHHHHHSHANIKLRSSRSVSRFRGKGVTVAFVHNRRLCSRTPSYCSCELARSTGESYNDSCSASRQVTSAATLAFGSFDTGRPNAAMRIHPRVNCGRHRNIMRYFTSTHTTPHSGASPEVNLYTPFHKVWTIDWTICEVKCGQLVLVDIFQNPVDDSRNHKTQSYCFSRRPHERAAVP